MQNANTDATLVCHANKPYDECLWTTPYGKTYTFSDQKSSHEGGRIAYFGFADTDCGVIVRNVQPKDNGGWQCQLHSRNGEIFQNASDVVSLFAGNYKRDPSIKPRTYMLLLNKKCKVKMISKSRGLTMLNSGKSCHNI